MVTDRRKVFCILLESTRGFSLISTGMVKFIGEEGKKHKHMRKQK